MNRRDCVQFSDPVGGVLCIPVPRLARQLDVPGNFE